MVERKLAPFTIAFTTGSTVTGPMATFTVAAGIPTTVAVITAVPTVAPSVTDVDARPCASVAADAGFTVAPVAEKVTAIPASFKPAASTTSTANGVGNVALGAPEAGKPETKLTRAGSDGSFAPKSNLTTNPSPRGNCARELRFRLQ